MARTEGLGASQHGRESVKSKARVRAIPLSDEAAHPPEGEGLAPSSKT
jgi:hypothetical protein